MPQHELILIVDYGSEYRTTVTAVILWFACFIGQIPPGHCDQIPAPPPIKTLQFRMVEHLPMPDHSEVIIEQVVAADQYRARLDMTVLKGALQLLPMPAKETSIIIYDPAKRTGIRYTINPDRKTVEQHMFSGDEPLRTAVASISGFCGALYPNDPNKLGEIERKEDEELDGVAAMVYQLTIHARPSLKWWMARRPDGIWIPLQFSARMSAPDEPERWGNTRVFDVRLDEPLPETLFVVPSGYTVNP